MRVSTLLVVCFALTLAHGDRASAIVIATSEHFQVTAEDIRAVGAGAAGEDLRAFTLTVTNISGDPDWDPTAIDASPSEGFVDGITGSFHQVWPFVGFVPTPYVTTGDFLTDLEIDTHFVAQPRDMVSIVYPSEDLVVGTSAEPPRDGVPDMMGFGTRLEGTFALWQPAGDTWELAHIAMPAGLLEFDVRIAGEYQVERLTGSELIGLPGDNYRPNVDAGGPYTIIDVDSPSLPDGGSVQFAGSATDFDGQVDGVLWEIARQGQGDWLPLPNGADTLDPILTESELRGMFGPALSRDQMFDLRLVATDNLGGTGLDTATLTYVPEPSTWLLLLLGSAGVWFRRRPGH